MSFQQRLRWPRISSRLLGHLLAVQPKDLDRRVAARVIVDRADHVLAELQEVRRILSRRVDEKRLLLADLVPMRFRPTSRIGEREVVALEPLVAELAAE